MPVKLGAKLPAENEARIEIIPLIDIMFFLLAAFMLISLSMVNLRSIRVDLPTATAATPDSSRDLLSLSVDKAGLIYLDQRPLGPNELATQLAAQRAANPDLRVFISGDRDARHGDIVRALDLVRAAGLERVAIEISAQPSGSVTAP
jgi:biopolymer transport protein ExbD